MSGLYFVLLLAGAACFLAAAAGRSATRGRRPIALLPLGLFFWILVPLIQTARILFTS